MKSELALKLGMPISNALSIAYMKMDKVSVRYGYFLLCPMMTKLRPHKFFNQSTLLFFVLFCAPVHILFI